MAQDQQSETTVRCILCEQYKESRKTFTCRKCGKSPFCLEHLDEEYKTCSGCASEERIQILKRLAGQEKALAGFLKFSQFIFMVVASFFVTKRFLYGYLPDYLATHTLFEYTYLYILGAVAVTGVGFSYVMLQAQKSRVTELEGKLHSHRVYSRFMR